MPKMKVAGIELAYSRRGRGDPVMLIAGLSGRGEGWGDQVDLFAAEFDVIVPDHPGTGDSGHPDRFSLEHHAEAMAGLIDALGSGPAHIVGSSTGGAIAQRMALDHPHTVRTTSLVSSWARADDFFRHQFAVRQDTLRRLGTGAYSDLTALFLFSPVFFRDHYEEVGRWRAAAAQGDVDVMSDRIDMIIAHDELQRLGNIDVPTLVLVGDADACTPPHLSRELAEAIPGADFVVLEGGHLIYKESVERFHRVVSGFVRRH